MLKRIILLAILGVILVLGIGAGSMYWAVTSTQPYYELALEQPVEVLEESSRQLENRFTTLTSDVQAEGEWQTVISAQEVNGWLAFKLPESFPNLLPQEVQDPRVTITADDLILAARAHKSGMDVVISVYLEPFVTEEGDLAVEIKQVLAGSLPWPTKELVDQLGRESNRVGLPVRWTQSDGNTVMIVEHGLWDTEDAQQRVLEAIELADGEMFLSGRTIASPAETVTESRKPTAKTDLFE
ncbi:hypothetical protein [Aeoliella mucimassa]|uniref:Uncharacterized protein n=1 Tax=Aeoliella mucimassa TaxID=2527972 RepID=A0A518ASL3_9BACT|nr:hypothetical protein [Aeoliella mucimassa]QDU57722.1 hypothetical protein Pan181_39440 [Aeoliella mucimassa]